MTDREAELLKQRLNRLEHRIRNLEKWEDTIHSRWYKRVAWWCMGFRFSSLGTWYNAPWNKPGQQYNGRYNLTNWRCK